MKMYICDGLVIDSEPVRVDGVIEADDILVSESATFGKNIDIRVRGTFEIGDYSRLGDDVKIRGNNVRFGKHLYHSRGLNVGGGGHTNPDANLTVGDRCTIHDNYINIACPVVLGDDVGLSREVSIQTHGYWLSVLEGFPAKFAGVTIGSGSIIGYRTVILPGVWIAERAVVGACSVVTKSLDRRESVYAGNPCRFIRSVNPPRSDELKREALVDILAQYVGLAVIHGYRFENGGEIIEQYPEVTVGGCTFNVETLEFGGEEDELTDHFRDYVRKWGIRFYSTRPFRSVINPQKA